MEDTEYERISLTVDIVVLTIRDHQLQVLLIERTSAPYRRRLAVPGGFVREGEPLHKAAVRELEQDTGIDSRALHLEQVRTYGDPGRDPRGRVVSVAHLGIAPDLPDPHARGAAGRAAWYAADDVLARRVRLAFDHQTIVADAVERARSKLEYTSLATQFCAEPFTIADLRRVYEAVWG